MKRSLIKRTVCVLLVVLLAAFALPVQSRAETAEGVLLFSGFEELRDLCAQAKDATELILFCETSDPVVIEEDLTIHGGTSVVFCRFRVPEGVTMTVSEGAQVLTQAIEIEGALYNEGSLIQDDTYLYEGAEDLDVVARIPGQITNRGEMVLTNVFGRRNVRTYQGHTTMNQTAAYDDLLQDAIAGDLPTPTATPTPVPTPEPPASPDDDDIISRVLEVLEAALPAGAFFLVLFFLFRTFRAAIPGKKGRGRAAPQQSSAPRRPAAPPSGRRQEPVIALDYSKEDHFQRDKRTRIAQLDEWLRNGLIDRKEYRVLKKRYEQDDR